MCGRTACDLDPSVIRNACTYTNPKTGVYTRPEWRDHPGSGNAPYGYQYRGSVNLTPTMCSPILFKDKQVEDSRDRVLQPMMWNLIPPWHKGDPKSHGLSTNNCRLEGLLDSKLFRSALKKRNFCIILCQGFYEWKTMKGDGKKQVKQPYFIVKKQHGDFKADDVTDETKWEHKWSKAEGWQGPELLMMAGIYDVWHDAEGNPVYSYSIITMESGEKLSWLHHRMPAILETEEQVEAWLNPSPNADLATILKMLKPATALEWYPVSMKVNNSRCQDKDCFQRVDLTAKKEVPKNALTSWLTGTKKNEGKRPSDEARDSADSKKPKMEALKQDPEEFKQQKIENILE